MKPKFIAPILFVLMLSCNNHIVEKNYRLDYSPNEEIYLVVAEAGYDLVHIPGHILFYGHNKDFIIACQKPMDSIYSYKENLVFDKMVGKVFITKFSQFWIVKLGNDSTCGPFNKSEYLMARKKMQIPESLKLDNSTLNFYLKGQRNDIEYKQPDAEIIDIKNLKGNVNAN